MIPIPNSPYIFNKNLKAARKHKPQIQGLISNASFDKKLHFHKTTSGKMGCFYLDENDQKINITGEHDPELLAEQIIAREYDNRLDSLKQTTTAVLFCVNPYVCKAFFKKFSEFKRVYTVFPSSDYFFSLCYQFDFVELLNTKEFMPLIANDKDIALDQLDLNLAQSKYIYSGLKIFAYSPFEKIAGELFELYRESIIKNTLLLQVNSNTAFTRGNFVVKNNFYALDKFLQYPNIDQLKDYIKGKPVLCIAAGSSLKKQLNFIKKIQDEVYIIAVNAALRPLLNSGIKPDLVTIMDMTPAVKKDLVGLDLQDIFIAIEMSCHYSVMEELNAKFILSITALKQYFSLQNFLKILDIKFTDQSFIRIWGTVAFMSIALAKKMGASEIIMLGQDLAYGDISHVEGANFSNKVEIIEQQGKKYFKVKDDLTGVLNLQETIEVKGFFGDTVLTNSMFQSFAIFLEKNAYKNLINCTEGGMYLNGLEHSTLKDVYIKKVKHNKIDKQNLPDIKFAYDYSVLPQKLKELKKYTNHFKKLAKIYNESLQSFVSYREYFAKQQKGELLSFKENISAKRHVQIINQALDDLSSVYKQESEDVGELFPESKHLFNMLSTINMSEFSDEELETETRDKVALLLSSMSEGLNLLYKEFTAVIKRIKKRFPEYFAAKQLKS